jgi:hypothetical protein
MDIELEKKQAEEAQAVLTAIRIDNPYCNKCIWRHDWGLGAKAPYCEMYPIDVGIPKPIEVQTSKARCDFFEAE